MARKLISLSLILLCFFSVIGCCNAEEMDYVAIFSPVVEEYYREIVKAVPLQDWQDGYTGIQEAWMAQDIETLLKNIGYAIQDVNGDGIPELMICEVIPSEDSVHGQFIYAMYSCVDGKPHILFDGWSRKRYHLLPDGTIYTCGSNGAAYGVIALYEINPDNTNLDCMDFWFTWETDETCQEYAVYHNTTGDYDKAVSQKLEDMSLEHFGLMDEVYSNLAVDIPLTTFADQFGIPSSVNAQINSDNEIVLTAVNGDLSDLKVINIRFEAVNDWGQLIYTPLSEISQGSLSDGQTLKIHMEFTGDIPNNAISFVNSAGVSHNYALNISGENGELILEEYFPNVF